MNIPLDRLYHFIENIAENIYNDCVIIYRFWPHGSKNIQDLSQLHQNTWFETTTLPNIWCHDQEPLNYTYYQHHLFEFFKDEFGLALDKILSKNTNQNLNYNIGIFSKSILLHSEQRSNNLKKYEQDGELIPVYYWSHAVIARDWFRYAEHVSQRKQVEQTFLIYSRAWSGTREYRLRFAELLVHLNLQDSCKTSVNPIEPELGIHYDQHTFNNPVWRPQTVLENFFPISTAHSNYSADFDIEDYEATDIEVVLETLFDDSRLHLTEKSLRPIACGQPFIIAGTHGSLEYLRSYGFKTFGNIWDESYDLIEDPAERLIQIAELMKQINNWHPWVREQKLLEAQTIADYNRQYFFSQEFFNRIVAELKTNMESAVAELKTLPANQEWIHIANGVLNTPELREILDGGRAFNGLSVSVIENAIQMATALDKKIPTIT